jgi:hypothetical protein
LLLKPRKPNLKPWSRKRERPRGRVQPFHPAAAKEEEKMAVEPIAPAKGKGKKAEKSVEPAKVEAPKAEAPAKGKGKAAAKKEESRFRSS